MSHKVKLEKYVGTILKYYTNYLLTHFHSWCKHSGT